MTYTITENNAATGESITREMTAEEIEKVEALIAADVAEAAKLAAKAAAKEAVLAKLGLTADEVAALLG